MDMKQQGEDKSQCEQCSSCSMHHHCWSRGRFFVLRWILGLLILGLVFGMGIKIGEFKAGFYGQDGMFYGRMHYGRQMMYQNYNGFYTPDQQPIIIQQPQTNTTSSAPAVKKILK